MCWRPESKLGQQTDLLPLSRTPRLSEFFRFLSRAFATFLLCLLLWPAQATDMTLHECDRIAAHPHDGEKVAAGVEWEWLDAELALPACETAVKDAPGVLRFQFQLARALNKAGRLEEAFRLYSELAGNGYVAAMASLGAMYEEGHGVSRNYAEALKWYRRGVEKGDALAQVGLGYLYLDGKGVPQSKAKAKEWMRLADAQGFERVRIVLCTLTKNETAAARRIPILVALLVILPALIFLWRARSPKSYFRRHWRGDLPLSWSLCANCILVNLLFFTALAWLGRSNHLSPPTTTTISIALLVFWAGLLPWQVVGCWRSAMFHFQVTGRTRPVILAQIPMLIVVIGILAFYGRAQVVSEKYGWIATVETDGFQILVLDDGKEIEVCGTMVEGIAEEVRKLLERSPRVEVMRLNSHGGWLQEGEKLLELIGNRNLATYSATGCNSACTIAFIGGRARILHKNARLGFHANAWFAPKREAWKGEHEVTEKLWNLEIFASRGVDEEFVVKISDTPHEQMWYPTHEELLQAGFITRVSDGSDFAPHTPLP